MNANEAVERLRSLGDPEAQKGMARFGIKSDKSFGVSLPKLRGLAREIGRDHSLALELWKTDMRDTRLLATMVDDPKQVTIGQMERWVRDFDSWDIVDGCCGNLFDRTPYAVEKAREWSKREREFERRAGFVLMAELAVHDRNVEDTVFIDFLPFIIEGSTDPRNFVKKAVNWALRQIGKRNLKLNKTAVAASLEIQKLDSRPAKWIASDALRELRSHQVLERLRENG